MGTNSVLRVSLETALASGSRFNKLIESTGVARTVQLGISLDRLGVADRVTMFLRSESPYLENMMECV